MQQQNCPYGRGVLVMKRLLLLSLLVLTMATPVTRAANAPVLFFTDLITGPATGNSDSTFTSNGGVYVTLYGNFLTPLTGVTLNGASCLTVASAATTWRWYQKMTVQLTGTCASGNFVVTTAAGTSNGLAFTVNAGTIRYVATTGSNANPGTFALPWLTLPFAVQHAGLTPGTYVYVESNVQQLADDGQWNGALSLRNTWCLGTAAQPIGLLAYPGATGIQIGPNSTATNGLVTTDFTASGGACAGNWVISGITIRGVSATHLAGGTNYRYIGNDVATPFTTTSGGGGATLETSQVTSSKFFGNFFHDMAPAATDRLIQGVYYSTDSNGIEHGWNEHSNSGGRASLQTHSSPLSAGNGFILNSMNIHDNTMHDAREECILIDTENPSAGTGVLIWNNVLYNCAKDGTGNSLHLQMSGDFDTSHGTGSSPPPFQWYNNTVYANNGGSCFGSNYPDIHTGFTSTSFVKNNLCLSSGTVPYWVPRNYAGGLCGNADNSTACQSMSGDKDLVFGNGGPTFPNLMTNQVNANPLLITASVSGCPAACVTDLHLQTSSPAIGIGSTVSPIPFYDHDGLVRPSPVAVGAYEFQAGAGGAPAVQLTPSSANFFNQFLGSTSIAQIFSLKNIGTATLTLSSISLVGTNAADFSQSNNCGASVAVNVTCTINVTFTPSTLALRSASLNVIDNAAGSPHASTVQGTGVHQISGVGTVSGTGLIKVQP